MTVKQYFKNGGVWNFECDLISPYRVMAVDVDFEYPDEEGEIKEDETQFDINAYDENELNDLFKDFLKENKIKIKDVIIRSVTIIQVAKSIKDLYQQEVNHDNRNSRLVHYW